MRVWHWFLAVLCLLLAGILGYAVYYSWREVDEIVHCRKIPNRVSPADFGWEYEDFSLKVEGIKIEGWYIPNRSRLACIFAPGYDGNRSSFLKPEYLHTLNALYAEGFDLVLFDPRGLGESGGELFALGAFADDDMIAVMDYLKREKGLQRFVLFGASAGASAVIRAAACYEPKEAIQCVIADSPYAKPDWTRVYPSIWTKIFKLIARLRFGRGLVEELYVVDYAERISRALFIVGEDDAVTPPINALELFRRATAPKELWVVPEAGHVQAASLYPEEYDERVISFIRKCQGIGLGP